MAVEKVVKWRIIGIISDSEVSRTLLAFMSRRLRGFFSAEAARVGIKYGARGSETETTGRSKSENSAEKIWRRKIGTVLVSCVLQQLPSDFALRRGFSLASYKLFALRMSYFQHIFCKMNNKFTLPTNRNGFVVLKQKLHSLNS